MLPSIFSLSAAFTGSKTGRKGSDNWDPIWYWCTLVIVNLIITKMEVVVDIEVDKEVEKGVDKEVDKVVDKEVDKEVDKVTRRWVKRKPWN